MHLYSKLSCLLLAFTLIFIASSCKTTKVEETIDYDPRYYKLVIKEGYAPEEIIEDYKKGFTKHEALLRSENMWMFEYAVSDDYFQKQYIEFTEDDRIIKAIMVGSNKMIRNGKVYEMSKSKAPVR